jgi:hypothetical protein
MPTPLPPGEVGDAEHPQRSAGTRSGAPRRRSSLCRAAFRRSCVTSTALVVVVAVVGVVVVGVLLCSVRTVSSPVPQRYRDYFPAVQSGVEHSGSICLGSWLSTVACLMSTTGPKSNGQLAAAAGTHLRRLPRSLSLG